ncbi:putative UMP/CMP kinase 4 [Panicum miliaceum]|uniref:UMP-CMP kinase n=1 Tax=Panicum miliaceum TaxID=4540 RepID=A0A3L6RQ30_PANMI|nr:putative UMP/CMP kinase 4 [Panicum miliaceum]
MGTVVDAPAVVAEEATENTLGGKKVTVVFVLGGPGSGKGTQCANIVEHFGFTHLSAGDLLRAEIKSGSENGTMIENMIKEGKIVPSEVTIKLLQDAMIKNENDKFLIDGFPRNEENRAAFENVTKISPAFVLFFECSEEEMERRLLGRNQGRVDDNIETIKKRFKTFVESSLPVIEYYSSKGKVKKIDAAKPIPEVFEDVKTIFSPYAPKLLFGAPSSGDHIHIIYAYPSRSSLFSKLVGMWGRCEPVSKHSIRHASSEHTGHWSCRRAPARPPRARRLNTRSAHAHRRPEKMTAVHTLRPQELFLPVEASSWAVRSRIG